MAHDRKTKDAVLFSSGWDKQNDQSSLVAVSTGIMLCSKELWSAVVQLQVMYYRVDKVPQNEKTVHLRFI